MTGRPARLLTVVWAAVLLAGCGGDPPSPAPAAASGFPALPPRPVELRLNGVDPCGLLTAAQLDAMKVPRRTTNPYPDADRFGSVGCSWGTAFLPPYGAPLIRLVTAQPISYFEYTLDLGRISEIDGFPAIPNSTRVGRPEEACMIYIDVAQGQTLEVQYAKLFAPPGTIDREQACARAREVGRAAITTLRARPGG